MTGFIVNNLRTAVFFLILILTFTTSLTAGYMIIPMDSVQNDHLKSYGIVFWALSQKMKVEWLLN